MLFKIRVLTNVSELPKLIETLHIWKLAQNARIVAQGVGQFSKDQGVVEGDYIPYRHGIFEGVDRLKDELSDNSTIETILIKGKSG